MQGLELTESIYGAVWLMFETRDTARPFTPIPQRTYSLGLVWTVKRRRKETPWKNDILNEGRLRRGATYIGCMQATGLCLEETYLTYD